MQDDQPVPIPTGEPAVWDLVLEDMRDRDRKGRAEYGVPLQPSNGRDHLWDLYHELLDAAVYARAELYKRYGK